MEREKKKNSINSELDFILNSKKVEVEAYRSRLASIRLKWNLEVVPESPLPNDAGEEDVEADSTTQEVVASETGSLFSGLAMTSAPSEDSKEHTEAAGLSSAEHEGEYEDVELSEEEEQHVAHQDKEATEEVAQTAAEETSENGSDQKENALKEKQQKEAELQEIMTQVQKLEEDMLTLVDKGSELNDDELEQCGTYRPSPFHWFLVRRVADTNWRRKGKDN